MTRYGPDCFALEARPSPALDLRDRFARQFVGAFVEIVAGMARDPVPMHLMRAERRVEPLPQVDILHRLLVGGLPAVPLPAVDPARDAAAADTGCRCERSTSARRFSASSAEIAAINSMRLLVVCASPPLISFCVPPHSRMAPQPPGPGLPEQAPSVWMTTCGSRPSAALTPRARSAEAVVARIRRALVKAQLADIFERVLRLHQRAGRHVEPVDEPRQQKAQRGAARTAAAAPRIPRRESARTCR